MNKKCNMAEVEKIIEEMDLSEIPDDVVELEDGYQLVVSGWYVHIPKLHLRLHEGVVGYWDEEMKEYMEDTIGKYVGIGVYIANDTKTNQIVVLAPIKESPAEKAGLQPGDVITKIDDVGLEKMCDLRKYIYSKKVGDVVRVSLIRNNRERSVDIMLVRK